MTARLPSDDADAALSLEDAPRSPEPSTAADGTIEALSLTGLESALETQPAVPSIAATILLVIASFYTLYFARAFFLPVTFGLLLNLLLSPFVRTLKRARIPEPMGAAI